VAALVARLAPRGPGNVGDALTTLLQSEVVLGLLVTVAIAVWYALARWLEPRLPDWLTRLVLGSAAAPTYARVTDDGAAVITTLDGRAHVVHLPAVDDEPRHRAE
jgi:MFS superfamily sulfate permease-like transporter